jgi:4-aminobutyrate aminotransferase
MKSRNRNATDTMDDTVKKIKNLLSPALVFHTAITAVKAEGIYVEDAKGRRYMDFTSALAVANIGHSHPAVVEAARSQLERFVHCGCIFHYASIAELAERLKKVTPAGIDTFFFSNSGAEAIEGAVKLARLFTGRQAVLAFIPGFHGRTLGAITLTTATVRYRRGYHPLLPSVFHSPYPYCYRCAFGKNGSTCSLECFKFLEWMFEHVVSPEEVACAVIEPVLGEGGYAPAPARYLKKLREFTASRGILLILDEVQTGFGRTGRWFDCERSRIIPDIMVMAKAIASGFPLSAVAGKKEIMRRWPAGAHGTTFGGNPVSCAAACATIDTIKKEGLIENAAALGDYTMERLGRLKKRHPSIGDVRGVGLMIGVEFVKKDNSPDAKLCQSVIKYCGKRGLIIIECGKDKNVIRLMPPLATKKAEMDKALKIFEEALSTRR